MQSTSALKPVGAHHTKGSSLYAVVGDFQGDLEPGSEALK